MNVYSYSASIIVIDRLHNTINAIGYCIPNGTCFAINVVITGYYQGVSLINM